jgi:hypothetical protein
MDGGFDLSGIRTCFNHTITEGSCPCIAAKFENLDIQTRRAVNPCGGAIGMGMDFDGLDGI